MTTPTSSGFDSGLLTGLVDFMKDLLGLFTLWPLNIFVIMAIAAGAIMLIKKAKRAAH